jgi:hypothetical protein
MLLYDYIAIINTHYKSFRYRANSVHMENIRGKGGLQAHLES